MLRRAAALRGYTDAELARLVRRGVVYEQDGCLLPCVSGGSPPGHVQSTGLDGGSVTSAPKAYTDPVVAGNFLVAIIRIGATGRTVTVSDNLNGTWTQATSQIQTTDGHQGYLYYLFGALAGATTVTVAISGVAATVRFAIGEYRTGQTPRAILDGTPSSAEGTASGVAASGTLTTVGQQAVLIGGGTTANAVVANWLQATSGGTWTIRQTVGSSQPVVLQDLSSVGPGAYQFNASQSDANWTSHVMAVSAVPDIAAQPLRFAYMGL